MPGTVFTSPLDNLNTATGLIVAFLLFVVGMIIVRLSHHNETMDEQYRLFMVGYAARIAMILLIYNGGLISIVTDADSQGWRLALSIHQQWRAEGFGLLTVPLAVYEGLPEVNKGEMHTLHKLAYAAVFLVTGLPGRIAAASLNALLGALIPVLSFRMSLQIYNDPKAARYLGWTLALMPSLLVFSALTAKEPFVVFFEVLGLYCCVQIAQRRFRLRYVLAFLFSLFCMLYLRFYIYYVLLGSIVVAVVVPVFIRDSFRKVAIVTGLFASPLVMYYGYVSAIAERKDEAARTEIQQRTTLQSLRQYGSKMGGNSFVENPFDITKPSQFVPGLLFGLVHLMYAPFPWNLARGSRLMLLTTPEVLWWYYSGTIRFYRGLRHGLRQNLADSLVPILFCLPLLYYYSLMFSNIGLAYRYRAQIYPELILFISLGYKRVRTLHGYHSYALPEQDEADEYPPGNQPTGQRQPWIARDRFDRDPGYQPTQWPNRNDRFRRM